MIDSLKKLIKNTAIIYTTEIIQRVLLFVVIIYAARVLGVKLFGDYSYAITILVILQTLSDFGFTVFLPREVASDKDNRDRLFHVANRLRVIFTVIMLALFMGFLVYSTDSTSVRLFVLVTGSSLVLSSYALNFSLTLRGLNMMKLDAAIRLTGVSIAAVGTLVAIRTGLGIVGIAYALALGNISMVGFSLWVNMKNRIVKKCTIGGAEYMRSIKKALPFGTIAIIYAIYTRIDTLLLQNLKGPVDVGLYHAGYKVLEAAMILPFALAVVLVPVLSEAMATRDEERTKKITNLGFKHMWYVAVLIAVLVFMLSDKIIEVLYFSAEYAGAIPGLKIFALVIISLFVSSVAGALIMSSPIAHLTVWINTAMLIICVALNILFIPKYGFKATASIKLVTEVFGLLASFIVIHSCLFRLSLSTAIAKGLIAGAATALCIFLAKSLLFIPLYLLVYAFVLHFLGGISAREFEFAKDLLTERFKKA